MNITICMEVCYKNVLNVIKILREANLKLTTIESVVKGLCVEHNVKSMLLILINAYQNYRPTGWVIDYSEGGLPQKLEQFKLIGLGPVNYN